MNQKDRKREESILWSLNILTTITTIVFLVLSQTDDQFDFINRWYVIVVIVLLYTIINHRRVITFVDDVRSKINFLLDIVIEYRRGHLEFLDEYGLKAMYNEESLFRRLRRNMSFDSIMTVDGKISDEVHTYNCYHSLNPKKNRLKIVFGKKTRNKNMFNSKRQLQFGFVTTLLDSYPKTTEFWGTIFKHYTKTYDLKISFFKSNPPKNVCLVKVVTNEKGEVLKDEKGDLIETSIDIDPLVMEKYGRIIMKIKLLHVYKGDAVRIYWDWNKP